MRKRPASAPDSSSETARKRARFDDAPQPLPSRTSRLFHARRLGLQTARTRDSRNESRVNLRGAKSSHGTGTGSFSATLRGNGSDEIISVTRKTSFAALLRRGVSAFVDRGADRLQLQAMGAALPLALALGPAIRDALPSGGGALRLRVTTGSQVVTDEMDPSDEEEDLVYRQRTKSTVRIVLAKGNVGSVHVSVS